MQARSLSSTRVLLFGGLPILAAIAVLSLSHAQGDPRDRPSGTRPEEGKGTKKASPTRPIFTRTVQAKNPTSLVVVADGQKAFGWVTGEKSFAGQKVTITWAGNKHSVTIGQDNTFVWPYSITKKQSATFKVGKLQCSELLTVRSAGAKNVFFVVDRSAYRPKQKLQFVGFLRRENTRGEFEPIPDSEVEVHLKARNKGTFATKMKLNSDAFGRITGEYTFLDADALDTYDLTIPGYLGKAEVKLAEFRKAKVRLQIDGEIKDRDLKLTFQALDFLNKRVPASKLHFTAKIVQLSGESKEHALNAEEFVYHASSPYKPFDVDGLPEDQKLLWEAGHLVSFHSQQQGHSVVAQRAADVPMGKSGKAEYTLALKREWTRGAYSVLLEGVLTDYNGREQRARKLISIGSKAKDCNLLLHLERRHFEVGEKIHLRVQPLGKDHKSLGGAGSPRKPFTEARATVVAMKLKPGKQTQVYHRPYGYYGARGYNSYIHHPYGYHGYSHHYSRLHHYLRARNSRMHPNLMPLGVWSPLAQAPRAVERQMVTATVLHNNVATFQFDEPGAYKLVCIADMPDGQKLQNEVGCVIRKAENMPGLLLKLDREEWDSSDKLTGQIHSRYTNARVLFTLHDSKGIRLWKVYQLKGNVQQIAEDFPAGLRYGCRAEVQYLDADNRVFVDSQFIRVKPTDRMLTVDVKTQKTYEPGEKVTLDLQVNRKERVDLVVSVYDQSLLGIAPDNSVDVRNFYLADERVRTTIADELLRRRIGNVTVEALITKAEKLLKEDKQLGNQPEGQALRQTIHRHRRNKYLYARDVVALLTLAGIDVRQGAYMGSRWYVYHHKLGKDLSEVTLSEVMQHTHSGWKLVYQFVGDALVLHEYHPTYWQRFAATGGIPGGMMFQHGYGSARARGDAHFSVAGNSFQSHPGAISGQSFFSHIPGPLPTGPGATPGAPIDLEGPVGGSLAIRRNFSDSAFWNAQVRTDEQGKARVTFKLPDSLTNWRVVVTAVSPRMHVGQTRTSFRTFKPIMVWPMIPRIFTEGDKVNLYASVHNRTEEPREIEVSLRVKNGKVLSKPTKVVRVPAKGNVPVYWTYESGKQGYTQILMTARCEVGSDASLKRLPVSRLAAEQIIAVSGFCKGQAELTIPAGVDLNDANLQITLVPSLADDMVHSLDYLVQYPYGCVEQTMSRFLPAIKVAQTLQRANIKNPSLEKKLPLVVAKGIKRLLQLQKSDGGWGWHGNGQTHEMMTPYALYGLLEAEKAGHTIPNENAVQRGLSRLNSFIGQMGEKQATDRIYCMYVYSHRRKLHKNHLEWIEGQLRKDKLSDYAMAMALEMAVQHKNPKLARRLAEKLHKSAKKAGDTAYWTTANFSRWGNDRFEITAAVLKAFVAYDKDDKLIAPILNFFASTKRGNRWNSTRPTAMVLYALCDYLATEDWTPGAAQNLTVKVNDHTTENVALVDGKMSAITIEGKKLHRGKNQIRFEGRVPGAMYRAVFRHWKRGRTIKPMEHGLEVRRQFFLLDDKGKQVREVKPGDSVPRGAYLQSVVTVRNKLGEAMRYVLVENPKPSTCEILPTDDTRFDQNSTKYALREDRTFGVVYHHEYTPATITDRSVLHVELTGEYVIPPAKVELMYQTLIRGHSGAFHFKVEDAGS